MSEFLDSLRSLFDGPSSGASLSVLTRLLAIATVLAVLAIMHRVYRRRVEADVNLRFRLQAIMLALTLVAFVLVVLMLPGVPASQKGNLLSLFGVLLSGAIALSATTFLGNGLAGLMLRALQSFKVGDFVRVQDQFGRVTERGLFHTEIQSEDRDLITLPNLFLVTNPTRVTSRATIVRADVSLGYDTPRRRVEKLLLEAAERAGLEDPFVSVTELGDFTVAYRISGVLEEFRELVSSRSRLHKQVLDVLHEGGVEIMSPRFLNVRSIDDEPVVPARTVAVVEEPVQTSPEQVMFEKADQAEALEAMRDVKKAIEHEIQSIGDRIGGKNGERVDTDEERSWLEARRERLEAEKTVLEGRIAAAEEQLKGES